jgi:hypothetical protein
VVARRWVVDPYLETAGPTVIFAPGGSGKSYFGLALAASVASGVPLCGPSPATTGPVAYLDWEADPDTQARRLASFGVDIVNVWYRRESAPLHTVAERLASRLADMGAVSVTIDSVGMARGGAPESAEDTIRLFAAIRQLGVPALCIDHVSKDQMARNGGRKMSFGSVYTTNAARLCWALIPAWRAGELALRLENTKSNNGPPANPRGLTLTFTAGSVMVTTSDRPPIIPTDDGGEDLTDRLANMLDFSGPSFIADLAVSLNTHPDTVSKALRRGKGSLFLAEETPGRPSLWKLFPS